MDEQDINHYILENHQDQVSMYLSWAGIEEKRAVYLADHNNVVRDLPDCSPDDWALVRAARHHIAGSENLDLIYSRWLGQEILASFEKKPTTTCSPLSWRPGATVLSFGRTPGNRLPLIG